MKTFLLVLFVAISSISQAQKNISLALNWKAEPQFGGFYETGLSADFKRLGYDLAVTEGGSGTPTVQMLANGKVDLAVVSAEEILLNNDKNPGHEILALFATFQTNPQMIMCRPENHFKSLAEVFNSKATLSMQNGLSYALFLKKKYPKATAKFVPYLGGITNFLNDKNLCQQGFFTSEPLLAKSKGIEPDVFLISQEGFNPYTTVVAIRAADARKLPVAKFVAAFRASWDRYLAKSESTNSIMEVINKSMDASAFKASADAQAKLIKNETDKTFKVGQMTGARWGQLISQMRDLGLIKQALKSEAQFFHDDSK